MIKMSEMHAITTVDGRYKKETFELSEYFSEFALMKTRYRVEIDYLKFLFNILKNNKVINFSQNHEQIINNLNYNFTTSDYIRVKEIEQNISHDLKAVEYLIRDKIQDRKLKELVHFGLTSHDINNIAVKLNLMDSVENIFIPNIKNLVNKLDYLSKIWSHIQMLGRTHGQVATPTKLGKEIMVFKYRLDKQICNLIKFEYTGKFGGATGNLNAHKFVLPKINWEHMLDEFLEEYNIDRQDYTTQITNYDNLSELLGIFLRINTILIDLCTDIWLYISYDYFKLKVINKEVGSSTMPYKVNPIMFENAEGNLKLVNSTISHLQTNLPTSRLQRDLTDSTVVRNLGYIFGLILKSYISIIKGLNRLEPNLDKINNDLDNNWCVVLEAIQTYLRLLGYSNAYEEIKELARGNNISKYDIHQFINGLKISNNDKFILKSISPYNY